MLAIEGYITNEFSISSKSFVVRHDQMLFPVRVTSLAVLSFVTNPSIISSFLKRTLAFGKKRSYLVTILG